MEQTDTKRRMFIERALPIHTYDVDFMQIVNNTVYVKCFEEESVLNACHQFQLAKVRYEPCPFPQSTLDAMFAKVIE